MLPAERFHPPPREYLGRCRPKFSDPCRSWDVHRSATGRSRLSLLITALTYIRGACVAAEAAIHGERHACVESDSAPKKRNIASRARRDHLSLRSSRRAHERSWNTRCSLHAYLLELSYSSSPLLSSVPEYLPMLIYSSVTRRDPLSPVPIGLRASLYETTQRFTSISYVAKVREDETRRRVGCYARGRELRASSFDRLPRSYGVFKSHATGNRFRSRFVWMDREEEGGGFFRVSIFDSVKIFSLSLCLSRFFFRVEGIIRELRRSGGVNDVCSSSPLYRHS